MKKHMRTGVVIAALFGLFASAYLGDVLFGISFVVVLLTNLAVD
jgi:hypothetical protein